MTGRGVKAFDLLTSHTGGFHVLEPAPEPVEATSSRFACGKPRRVSRRTLSRKAPVLVVERCGELISEALQPLECDLDAVKGLELLGAAGVTSAPVVDDNGVLVGIVLLATLARLRKVEELEVEDAMLTDVVSASRDATIGQVARLMAHHQVERVPVVSEDGHLLGVVSAMDVVCWLADRLP